MFFFLKKKLRVFLLLIMRELVFSFLRDLRIFFSRERVEFFDLERVVFFPERVEFLLTRREVSEGSFGQYVSELDQWVKMDPVT